MEKEIAGDSSLSTDRYFGTMQTERRPSMIYRVPSSFVNLLIAATMLSGSSLRQTVHTHRASIHQAAKLVAALLRVARVTAGWAESNGSLPPGL